MPFENFYKAQDEADRRRWKCFALAFLLFIGYWTFAFYSLPAYETDAPPPEIESEANRAERFRRVEELCGSFPTPEKFFFNEQYGPVESETVTLISNHYHSDRDWEEIMPFFTVWLSTKGFEPYRNNEKVFTKGNQTVRIGKIPSAWANYEIVCSERQPISFGIYD